jgi:hypothetical protein
LNLKTGLSYGSWNGGGKPRRTQPAELSREERALILTLAKNMPAIWHAASTTAADRQRIVRLMLHRVTVLMTLLVRLSLLKG